MMINEEVVHQCKCSGEGERRRNQPGDEKTPGTENRAIVIPLPLRM